MAFSHKITVFTPTYNRAYILENLYRSLQRQSFTDFEWLVVDDKERSVLIFVRRDKEGNEIIVASNFTPVPRHDYRFGINQPGKWREILNTDSMHYHGSNAGNGGAVHSDEIASHGRQHSLSLTLPPLATIWLVREAE